MSYTAGNLDLQLTAISSEAVSSLDTVINKLSSLSSVLHSVTTTDMKWINSFGTKMKNLSKKMTDIDWSTIDAGFNRLTVSITPFINKVATAETSLKSLNEMLTKVSGKKLNISSNGLGKLNFGRIFNLAMIRRFATYMANVVQYGTNFTETLNLWQVAMRENLDQADEFIKKMNKAYSISQQTLMNAQAIFKNMIGSLGNISDTVAYQLSESIVQMAADFSSLYNTTFEQAITKFQAALAGQVRPIRSVSGYDITESTLYKVYQELGGTKTVRQLNRTEKQLLSIYAVFQQMQRSGAVGDLSKTLDNFANQSRMMTENFKELQTYVGLFFQDLLQSWGVMKYINATLIFLTEIVKSLTKYEAPNFIEGMFDSTVAENEALDELQGKLLDFDKFRALDSSQESDLAIDQTILDAVSDYQSILDEVNNEARQIAESWLKISGILNNPDGIKTALVTIATVLGGIASLGLVGGAKKLFAYVTSGFSAVKALLTPTNFLIAAIAGTLLYLYATHEEFRESVNNMFVILSDILNRVIVSILPLVDDLLTTAKPILEVVGDLLVFVVGISNELVEWLDELGLFDSIIYSLQVSFEQMKAGIAVIAVFFEFLVKAAQTIYTVMKAVANLDFGNLKNSLSGIWSNSNWRTSGLWNTIIPNFATGASNIDSGTVFRAGEFGKVETVYTASNGKTNIANVQQMKAAFYQALVEYGQTYQDNQSIVITLDGEVIYRNTTAQAKRRGQYWSNK